MASDGTHERANPKSSADVVAEARRLIDRLADLYADKNYTAHGLSLKEVREASATVRSLLSELEQAHQELSDVRECYEDCKRDLWNTAGERDDLRTALEQARAEGGQAALQTLVSAMRKVLSPELRALVEAECRRGLAASVRMECGNWTPQKAGLPAPPLTGRKD